MTRPFAFVVPAVAILAACSPPPGVGPAASLRCDAAGAGKSVYIDIEYAPGGMPSATPDPCVISRGTQVEWRGPDGSAQAFEIRYKRANPMPSIPRGRLASKQVGNRQAASGRADAAPGTYDYAIRAGSQERDPAIIIR
jgi:hypothetical protein